MQGLPSCAGEATKRMPGPGVQSSGGHLPPDTYFKYKDS